MKIGYFIQNYKRGGVNTFIKNLVSAREYQDQIFIISNYNNPGIEFLKNKSNKNIKYLYYSIFSWDTILNKNFPKIIIRILKIIYSILFPISFIYQIIKLNLFFKKNSFDKIMIVNGGYPGGDLCLAAVIAWNKIYPQKKPWLNFHNFALQNYRFFLLDFYKNYIDTIISKSIKGFVSVSHVCSKSVLKRKNLKKNKIVTIYNGHFNFIKKKKFFIKKKFGLPRNSKILLMLAEYDLRKGHEFIIKVMENIVLKEKNIFLFIYGYGEQNFVKKIVEKSSAKKNIFLNSFEENNIGLINECNVLVIPSQEYESFGYTAIEAMSQKKPVVATDSGGLPEVITNNVTGFIIKKNNPIMFSNKILDLIYDKKIQKKFCTNSYIDFKKRFSHIKMIKSYNNLIKHNRIKIS